MSDEAHVQLYSTNAVSANQIYATCWMCSETDHNTH